MQAMAGKTAPSLLDLQKDAIKAGTRNAGGGETSKEKGKEILVAHASVRWCKPRSSPG